MFNNRLMQEWKTTWLSIPDEVRDFLKRALLIFVVWKLLYGFILFPLRFPDKQLTHVTSGGTRLFLSLVYPANTFSVETVKRTDSADKVLSFDFDDILMNGAKIVGIADGCNGLELFVLYLSFLCCVPAAAKRMTLFSFGGLVIIYVANILRCGGIAAMNIKHHSAVEIAHHYVFKILVYGLIFGLWMLYLKTPKQFNIAKT